MPAQTRFVERAILWLPAVAACAYVVTVAAKFPHLVHALNWNTDASAAYVLAERLRGDGPVWIPHFGWWTSMWWLLATRDLPGHEQLWEATGYAFALAGAGLLGWATAQVAGRWAGVTAAAASVIVGPFALMVLLTVNFHVSTPFTVALLSAYLVLLQRTRSRLLAAAVGLVVGLNAASDPLLWVAGVAPFVVAAVVFTMATRSKDLAVRAGLTLAVTVVSALATTALMSGLGFHLLLREFRPAHFGDLTSNIMHFGRTVALLGGANYLLPGGYPREPLRLLVAVLAAAAVAAAVLAGVKHVVRRSAPTTLAFACYWAVATVLLTLSILGTTNATAQGPSAVNYVLTLALAAGAGVALLTAGSRRGRLAAGLAIALVGAVNVAGIIQDKIAAHGGPLVRYEEPVKRLLLEKGVTRGYAGYWDAQSFSWQSGMRLTITPVGLCGRPQKLCPDKFFAIESWFEPHDGPSFLIVDPRTEYVAETPAIARDATEVHHFGPMSVYLFPYDIARHIRARRKDDNSRT